MSFLTVNQIESIKKSLVTETSLLGKFYKSKKKNFYEISIEHNLVEDYKKDGWEVQTILKTKTKMIKEKHHSKKFEDKVWCQLYDLGYRTLNKDENFNLP